MKVHLKSSCFNQDQSIFKLQIECCNVKFKKHAREREQFINA